MIINWCNVFRSFSLNEQLRQEALLIQWSLLFEASRVKTFILSILFFFFYFWPPRVLFSFSRRCFIKEWNQIGFISTADCGAVEKLPHCRRSRPINSAESVTSFIQFSTYFPPVFYVDYLVALQFVLLICSKYNTVYTLKWAEPILHCPTEFPSSLWIRPIRITLHFQKPFFEMTIIKILNLIKEPFIMLTIKPTGLWLHWLIDCFRSQIKFFLKKSKKKKNDKIRK